MIEWISAQPALFWLCLGVLLLIAEMLGTAGYLLWSGMAALCDVTERLFKITQLRTCPSLADRYSGRKKINMDCQHA